MKKINCSKKNIIIILIVLLLFIVVSTVLYKQHNSKIGKIKEADISSSYPNDETMVEQFNNYNNIFGNGKVEYKEEDWEYEARQTKDWKIKKYKGNSQDLVVPIEHENNKVTRINNYAFSKKYLPEGLQVTSLKLPYTINTISIGAFSGVTEIKELELPDGLVEIANNVFDCLNDGVVKYRLGTKTAETLANKYKGDEKKLSIIKPESIQVTKDPKTTYNRGEELDLDGGELTVTYTASYATLNNQDVVQKVPLTDSNVHIIDEFDNTTPGEKTLTIDYLGTTTTLKVNVNKPKLDIIEVRDNPRKDVYIKGESFDPAGMTISALYIDDFSSDEVILTNGFEYEPKKLTKVGRQPITISYEGKTTTFNVVVLNNNKETYPGTGDWVFEQRTTGDWKVNRYMGSSQDLQVPVNKIGDELPVTRININAFSTENLPEGLEVKSLKLPYTINTISGNAFSGCTKITELELPDGLEVLADNVFDCLGDGVVKYRLGTTTAEKLAKYNGDKNKLSVIVPESLTISGQKTNYELGQDLDKNVGKLTATYTESYATNNQKVQIDNISLNSPDVTITGFDKQKSGTQKVNVTYANKTITYDVTVAEKTLTEIKITKQPSKTDYIEGQDFNPEGMEVTAVYSDGSEEIVENYEVTDGNNLVAGKNTVEISYTEGEETKTTTQSITVDTKKLTGMEITKQPNKKQYVAGEKFDSAGMEVTVSYDNNTNKILSDEEYTIVDGDNLKAGTTSVTVKYTENGISIEKTVSITVLAESILKENSEYKTEKDNESLSVLYITKVMPKTSIEKFEEEIIDGYDIEIYDKGNLITNKTEYVKTNMKMVAKKDGETVGEYILVVIGDCNGNGTTNVSDLTKLMISIAENLATTKDETKILNGAYAKAVDLNEDGNINVSDVTKLCEFIANHK